MDILHAIGSAGLKVVACIIFILGLAVSDLGSEPADPVSFPVKADAGR